MNEEESQGPWEDTNCLQREKPHEATEVSIEPGEKGVTEARVSNYRDLVDKPNYEDVDDSVEILSDAPSTQRSVVNVQTEYELEYEEPFFELLSYSNFVESDTMSFYIYGFIQPKVRLQRM